MRGGYSQIDGCSWLNILHTFKTNLVSVLVKDFQQYSIYSKMTLRNMKLIQTIIIQTNKGAQFYDNLNNIRKHQILHVLALLVQHQTAQNCIKLFEATVSSVMMGQ